MGTPSDYQYDPTLEQAIEIVKPAVVAMVTQPR